MKKCLLFVGVILAGLFLLGTSIASSQAEVPNTIDAKVHEVVEGDLWNMVNVVLPDGNIHSFFVDSMWKVVKSDMVRIQFRTDYIMHVRIVTPYLVLKRKDVDIELR